MRMSRATSFSAASLCGIVGLWSMAEGFVLFYDPTGEVLELPTSLVVHQHAPENLLPGAIFAGVLGLGGLATAIEAGRARRRSARVVGSYGFTVVGWMAAQLVLMGLVAPSQQLGMAGLGLLITWLGMEGMGGSAG
jgi:hypothetical protein